MTRHARQKEALMSPLIPLKNPFAAPAAPPPDFALWQLGFRPFYLLASVFSALSIGLWALQFSGWLGTPYLSGPMWHAHEMLFGFALAVIVGFLFTAGRSWSGQPTPTGVPLMALAALWVAGRVLVLTPFGWAAAIVNVAFPLAAAIGLAIPFIAARNKRNYFFVALLLLMALAVLGVHLAQLGVTQLPGWIGIQVALDVVLFIMVVMAGRVVPMFTNAIAGANASKRPWLEKAALGSTLAVLLADVLQLHGAALVTLVGLCAAAHLARWALWQPWKTLRTPLVWVLHVAYVWIPVHLLLRGLAELGLVSSSAAVHALTVGAIGGLIIGMITRTALGHTGRKLKASRTDTVCYLLVLASAVIRVFVPLFMPSQLIHAVLWSAALWSAAFALYAVAYWLVLTRIRADGKPG